MTKILDLPDDLILGRRHAGFFEDFDHLVSADRWTVIDGDAGASVSVGDAENGEVTLTTGGTDNNEAYIHTTTELFKFADGKPHFAEIRLQYAEANTDDANVMFGFMDGVAANAIQDDGAGPKASYDGAVFFKTDGETLWHVESSNAGTQTTTKLEKANKNNLSGEAQTAGGSSFQTLRIDVQPISSSEAEVRFWIDGTHVAKHTLSLSSLSEMAVVFGAKAGSANSETPKADYIAAYKLR